MERISKEALGPEDFTYIDDYEQYLERVRRYDRDKFNEGLKEGREEGRIEGRIEGEKRKASKSALKLFQKQTPLDDIMEITELSIEEILHLQQLFEEHGDRAVDFIG